MTTDRLEVRLAPEQRRRMDERAEEAGASVSQVVRELRLRDPDARRVQAVDDVVAALRTAMRERGVSFKEVLNSAVRSGLSAANPPARPYRVTPFTAELRPGTDLTKINRLLADWEDEEILRKLELGK